MTNKVINFREGSKHYFELGNYYYYKNNLDKALTYYERALAVDPANPVNHFNLACLLSELGNFKKSTSIFKRIVKEMDSGLSESWFWLAMNSGQQQQYREASKYLRKYLEQEPEGDYSWQAEEILDYLRTDLPMLSQYKRDLIEKFSAQGVELVSKGLLPEAIKCFTRASAIEPELIAPKNNLALSWFQMGKIGKAIEVTREVLEREPQNLFANCNLAAFSYIVNDELAVRRQIQILDQLWSDDPDEMLKLGTTYGLLGLDRRAMNLFRGLRETCPSYEVQLLLGISTYNCGYLAAAAGIFAQANQIEPESPYVVYMQYCAGGKGKIPYHLRIPNEAIARILEGKAGPEELKTLEEPEVWSQMLWVIEHCSSPARNRLCAAVLDLNCQQLINKLQARIWQRGVGSSQKDIYDSLRERGIDPWRRHYWCKGLSSGAAAVLEGAVRILDQQGCGYFALALVHKCWTSYWLKNRPPIRNVQLWTAALLVFVQGLENLEAVAGKFDLAPASLAKAVKKLTVCI
jgi:tetratricopeptide (TPR) repeat protein